MLVKVFIKLLIRVTCKLRSDNSSQKSLFFAPWLIFRTFVQNLYSVSLMNELAKEEGMQELFYDI